MRLASKLYGFATVSNTTLSFRLNKSWSHRTAQSSHQYGVSVWAHRHCVVRAPRAVRGLGQP